MINNNLLNVVSESQTLYKILYEFNYLLDEVICDQVVIILHNKTYLLKKKNS